MDSLRMSGIIDHMLLPQFRVAHQVSSQFRLTSKAINIIHSSRMFNITILAAPAHISTNFKQETAEGQLPFSIQHGAGHPPAQ